MNPKKRKMILVIILWFSVSMLYASELKDSKKQTLSLYSESLSGFLNESKPEYFFELYFSFEPDLLSDKGVVSFLKALFHDSQAEYSKAALHYEEALKHFEKQQEIARYALLSHYRLSLLKTAKSILPPTPVELRWLITGSVDKTTPAIVQDVLFFRSNLKHDTSIYIQIESCDENLVYTGNFPNFPIDLLLKPVYIRSESTDFQIEKEKPKFMIFYPKNTEKLTSSKKENIGVSFSRNDPMLSASKKSYSRICGVNGSDQRKKATEREELQFSLSHVSFWDQDDVYIEIRFLAELQRYYFSESSFEGKKTISGDSIWGASKSFEYATVRFSIPRVCSKTNLTVNIEYLPYSVLPDEEICTKNIKN